MPNIARLKKLLEHVEKLPPDAIYMHWYKSDCGTAACLMGHAVTAFPEEFEWGDMGRPVDKTGVWESCVGSLFFDLTKEQWIVIFHGTIPNDKAVSNLRERIQEWEKEEQGAGSIT